MKILAILALFAFAPYLGSERNTIETVIVKPYKSLQNYEHFRRLVLETDHSGIDNIAGFKLEWGYQYKLSVNVEKLKSTLSDGTGYNYSLNKVISKTKVADTTEFKLFIAPHRYYYGGESEEMNALLTSINDSTFLYCEEVEIEVPTALMAVFKTTMSSEQGKIGHFTFVQKNRIRLVRM